MTGLPLAVDKRFKLTFEFASELGVTMSRFASSRLVFRPKPGLMRRAALRAALDAGFDDEWRVEHGVGGCEEWLINRRPECRVDRGGAASLTFEFNNPGLRLLRPILCVCTRFRLRVGGVRMEKAARPDPRPDGAAPGSTAVAAGAVHHGAGASTWEYIKFELQSEIPPRLAAASRESAPS